MQFQVIMLTDPHTHKHTHPPTSRQDRLQYTAPQLARSVIITNQLLVLSFHKHFIHAAIQEKSLAFYTVGLTPRYLI